MVIFEFTVVLLWYNNHYIYCSKTMVDFVFTVVLLLLLQITIDRIFSTKHITIFTVAIIVYFVTIVHFGNNLQKNCNSELIPPTPTGYRYTEY